MLVWQREKEKECRMKGISSVYIPTGTIICFVPFSFHILITFSKTLCVCARLRSTRIILFNYPGGQHSLNFRVGYNRKLFWLFIRFQVQTVKMWCVCVCVQDKCQVSTHRTYPLPMDVPLADGELAYYAQVAADYNGIQVG